MKNLSKKIMTFLLSILVVLTTGQLAFANTKSSSECKILSKEASATLISYAEKSYKRHISNIGKNLQSYGLEYRNVSEFSLGKPFSLYYTDEKSNFNTYYFPIIYRNNIEALLCVMEENGNFTSVFEKGFANELNNLLEDYNYSFKIFNIDGDIMAVSKEKEVLLSKGLPSENAKTISKIDVSNLLSSETFLKKSDLKTPIMNSNDIKSFPGNVLESNNLPMGIVLQNGRPWCWAATCAGIINYVKNENLSAEDVVVFVFGYAADKGGYWTEIKQAYNHWDLYPHEMGGTMPYWQVKDKIDSGKPIHLYLNAGGSAHAVTLKGYQKYSGSNVVYSLIDPNKDYAVSMDVNDSNRGFAYYPLNGKAFYWLDSISGF